MEVIDLLKPSEAKIKKLNELIKRQELSIQDIENEIMNSNNIHLIYLAGINIEGINLGRISHIISKSNEGYYIVNFAYFIILKNHDYKSSILKDLANGIKRCKEAKFMYYYLKIIPDAPIKEIIESILLTDNADYIYYTLRDIGPKLNIETKKRLAYKLIELKSAEYIVWASLLVPEIDINEYAKGLLQSKRTMSYGVYICKLLETDKPIEEDIKSKLIEALISTGDFKRIIRLVENSEKGIYIKVINQLLNNHINYSDSNFWLNYIIPLAVCEKECSSYAVDKIISSGNVEFITITIYYIKDEELKKKLQESLKRIPNLNDAYDKANVSDKVIKRVLIQNIAG